MERCLDVRAAHQVDPARVGHDELRTLPNGQQVIQSTPQGEIYLIGQGAGPRGERPFVDRLSIRDLSVQRLFQSSESAYEQPLAPLDGGRWLLQRESPVEPPNLYLREPAAEARQTMPAPTLYNENS